MPSRSGLWYDRQDHELLALVDRVVSRDRSRKTLRTLMNPALHPSGIKELAAPRALRVAFAMLNLLDSLEAGRAEERLQALRAVRDEVLTGTDSAFRLNTARVLLEIMKDVVRSDATDVRRLRLAHNFRQAAGGKARVIRRLLKQYHLLEMPEDWSQVAFDFHVHDANTKGRKSPTHLIMDAWIKGIRTLGVISYNSVRPESAHELLEAAAIMGIDVRIGVELPAKFRGRFVQLIWVPWGFLGTKDFLQFLAEPEVQAFMRAGEEVSQYQESYVLGVLDIFNRRHRQDLAGRLGVDLGHLERGEFLDFVGTGQASILHLGEFIHSKLVRTVRRRTEENYAPDVEPDPTESAELQSLLGALREMDSETIVDLFLRPDQNPEVPNPHMPTGGNKTPELLQYSPAELTERLSHLRTGLRVTLNLSELSLEDVLELLYDCEGRITHLEIFNLKDLVLDRMPDHERINELQQALNAQDVVTLKKIIGDVLLKVEASNEPGRQERAEKLHKILGDIPRLCSFYAAFSLKSRMGSDSTGRSQRFHGMGMAVFQTLPARAQREILDREPEARRRLPVSMNAALHRMYTDDENGGVFLKRLRRWQGLRLVGMQRSEEWKSQYDSASLGGDGNIVTLGGVPEKSIDEVAVEEHGIRDRTPNPRALNTGLRNALMVVIGLIPAFATFALTKDWWLLQYFGAFIWFGITGFRNILQSVLGGGGLRRSPLLRWNDYVSWERVSDSLFYTGFSVPLLDYLVKTLILDRTFGITTQSNALALYTFMALANGIYLSSHNLLRGLPSGAVYGNFFRSILSIPIAIVLNGTAAALLGAAGVASVDTILQKWAAIISKTASDMMAGLIEGLADRHKNIKIRLRDYAMKIDRMRDIFGRLETMFPEEDVSELVDNPKALLK
ncbi:MAG: hypothetical protein DRJ65_21985, partial [Acidobacteria bacterium]